MSSLLGPAARPAVIAAERFISNHLNSLAERGIQRVERAGLRRVRGVTTPTFRRVRRRIRSLSPITPRALFDTNSRGTFPSMAYRRRYGMRRRRYGRRRYGRRRYRARFSRRRIGMPIGSAGAKKHLLLDVIQQSMDTKTFQPQAPATLIDITDIGRGSNNEINLRERELANIRGLKMCFMFTNLNTQIPVMIHVAVVSPKKSNNVVVNDFFRAYGSARSQNADTSGNSNLWNCTPINSDIYTILMHKRFTLNPSTNSHDSQYNTHGRNYRFFKRYLKIKRQVRYDTSTTAVEGNIFIIWWADFISQDNPAATVATVRYDAHLVTIFRDPRN